MVQLFTLVGLWAIPYLVTATPVDTDRRGVISLDNVAADVLFPRTHGDSADFSAGIASGLSACSAGASSGSVDSSHKASLASWCKSSGSKYFSQDIVGEISSWCSGKDTATLSASTCSSIQSGLKSSHGKNWGSCNLWGWLGSFMGGRGGESYVAADAGTQSGLQAFFQGSESAQVDSNTLGALKICGAGGASASLNAKTKSDCLSFLSKPSCPLEAKVIAGVKAWLSGKGKSGQDYCSASGSASVSIGASATVTLSISKSIGISPPPTTPAAATTPPAGSTTNTPPVVISSNCSCSEGQTTVETTLSTAAVPSAPPVSNTSPASEFTTAPTVTAPSNTGTNTPFSSATAPAASTSSVVPFTGAATKGRHPLSYGGIGGLLVGVFGGYLVMG